MFSRAKGNKLGMLRIACDNACSATSENEKNGTMNFEQKINYIGKGDFAHFNNCHAFPDISNELKMFLQETGFYSHKMAYPYFTTTGKLLSVSSSLLGIAENRIGRILCIDLEKDEALVVFNPKNEEVTIVNSSLKKYTECLNVMRYFTNEIETKNIFGSYEKNRVKYAHKLLEMFNEVEGDIRKSPIWSVQVYERENWLTIVI